MRVFDVTFVSLGGRKCCYGGRRGTKRRPLLPYLGALERRFERKGCGVGACRWSLRLFSWETFHFFSGGGLAMPPMRYDVL